MAELRIEVVREPTFTDDRGGREGGFDWRWGSKVLGKPCQRRGVWEAEVSGHDLMATQRRCKVARTTMTGPLAPLCATHL
jgi:hypothetical protein